MTNCQVVREMLSELLNGEVLMISEKEYLETINGYLSYHARTAGLIRRELLPIVILASDYYDEVGRKLIDLEAVNSFLISVLNPALK